jgi:hypothetical protein
MIAAHLEVAPLNAGDRDFSQEDQKDRRREIGVRAAASGSGAALRAEWRGEPSNLLSFCPSCEISQGLASQDGGARREVIREVRPKTLKNHAAATKLTGCPRQRPSFARLLADWGFGGLLQPGKF